MSVPDAALNCLLDNLSQVLLYNYHLVADVRENILKLQRELMTLKGLMQDFSTYNHDSDYLKQTANEIRTILGEAEDAVDTYLLQAAVPNSRTSMSKAFHQMTDYPIVFRDVGRQIEQVGDKLKMIIEEKVKNGFEVLQDQAITNLNRAGNSSRIEEAPKVEEEHVIGFDGASQQVEALLTGGPEHLEVISIVGMLGLGKTTLAKKVYKDRDVDFEFMFRAFVYVSKEYCKREVLLNILTSFTRSIDEEVTKMNEEKLEKHVYHQLEGKQYLVVLDDVWDTEDWDRFKCAFPNNKKRCRVLITTRNEKVAEYANPKNPYSLYRLDFLRLDESRELLRWRVFNANDCPTELQEYEVQIAGKCDGLPLAVMAVAGIIVNHPDRVDWWREVANSVRDYIARDSTQTMKVMELAYKHLPNHLKPCFLYLGVFPEDFEIPVWKLVRLWIAEGLIQQQQQGGNLMSWEDIAEHYLEEIVNRNLVMVGRRRKSNGKIKTCRMNEAMLNFCKYQAKEENLFQEINNDRLSFYLSGEPALNRYFRLCINNANVVKFLGYVSGAPFGNCVRSFLNFSIEEIRVEKNTVFPIPETFKLLRVLEIQSLKLNRFPLDICNLVLLRYLAISSKFWSLPPAMSGLWNLQTLIVNTTSIRVEIKVDVFKMPHFRHLHTNRPTILPCPDTENQTSDSSGKNIQTLYTISPESCRKEVFDRTPNLKKLGIRGTLTKLFEVSDSKGSLFGNLRNLESLENLKLLNDDVTSRLQSLPSEESFPKQLTKLTLFNTFLDWKEMSTLGKLHKLEALKLGEYAFEGRLWLTEKGGFWSLKHLHIGRTNLVVWEVSSDHFPTLRSLELNGCEKLQAVPHGLADIPSLQSVVLYCTNPQVASSARRLQILKLEQAGRGHRNNSFELSVYPPEH